MRTDESNNKHLIAEDGKVFRRISDGWIAGPEIYLGKTYHLGGERLDTPLEELPGHYEEIDDPVAAETVLLDEDTDMEEAVSANDSRRCLHRTSRRSSPGTPKGDTGRLSCLGEESGDDDEIIRNQL